MAKLGKGYIQNKMSVNAAIAHGDNILPLSKWRKTIFVEEVEYITDLKVKKIKGSYKSYLQYSEWHHTGSLYNVTKFYKVDGEKVMEAVKNGEIIFYTEKEEYEIFQKELQEIEARKEKIELRQKEEKEQKEIELAELKTANITERKTKKGGTISTVEITEAQPLLYNNLKNGHYVPTKEYARMLNISNILEFKLV